MLTRDLMTLARERAIPMAYLMTGDEDLREAVVAAQDLGVQVILLGITAVPGLSQQSFTLINECDGHVVFDKDFLSQFFSRMAPNVAAESEMPLQPVIGSAESEEETAREIGLSFCDRWFADVGVDTGKLVLSNQPLVPKDVDAPLLRGAEAVFGSLKAREDLRRVVRQAFLSRLKALLEDGPLEDGESPHPETSNLKST